MLVFEMSLLFKRASRLRNFETRATDPDTWEVATPPEIFLDLIMRVNDDDNNDNGLL